jgi:hypothetical protein
MGVSSVCGMSPGTVSSDRRRPASSDGLTAAQELPSPIEQGPGLVPVLDAGTAIGDASPVVDRELCALVGEPARTARRLRALRHRRPAVVVP